MKDAGNSDQKPTITRGFSISEAFGVEVQGTPAYDDVGSNPPVGVRRALYRTADELVISLALGQSGAKSSD